MQVPTLRHLVEITHHLCLAEENGLVGLQGLDLGRDRFVGRQFNGFSLLPVYKVR